MNVKIRLKVNEMSKYVGFLLQNLNNLARKKKKNEKIIKIFLIKHHVLLFCNITTA